MYRFLFALLWLGLALQGSQLLAQNPTATPNMNEPIELAVITVPQGDMVVYLSPLTPKHRENFLKLAREGFYDGTTFHRVIKEFMIQGGDNLSKDDNPENDGTGGPGYTIPAELNTPLFHKRGALAAARLGDEANPKRESSGSQFYLVHGRKFTDAELTQMEQNLQNRQLQDYFREYVDRPENAYIREINWQQLQQTNPDSVAKLSREIEAKVIAEFKEKGKPFRFSDAQRKAYTEQGGAPFLDAQYTVFGELVAGYDVLDKVATTPTGTADRPNTKVPMTVKLVKLTRAEILAKYNYTVPN